MRRVIAILLAVVLLGGVGWFVWRQLRPAAVEVHGVAGSEKLPFLRDERVVARFRELGYELVVEAVGSRQIATHPRLREVDFAFPSSETAAARVQQELETTEQWLPFDSPMVVLSWQPVVDALTAEGLVETDAGGAQVLDMAALFELLGEDARWDGLREPVPELARGQIMVRTTDVRTSNSAAMYLALAGYLGNGETPVAASDVDDELMEPLAELFLDQGELASSSEYLFENYAARGVSYSPMVFTYESHFVDEAMRADTRVREGMAVMYPSPSVVSGHVVVPVPGSETGSEVGRLLTEDPELQRLAAEYGFRPREAPDAFAEVVAGLDQPARQEIADVIGAPTYESLERMIQWIEDEYQDSGMAAPAPADPGADIAPRSGEGA
ncbi:hypothetical protein [Allonocardiopsis opalescens]|uniref:Extracellular solute-binding protein n=1 Tax=Allonocardiopsis opalescens TaxID=1144618 RepID=A0A2T0Q9M2_9ACTN|nr:hypothetical protein [Allonocardiopsis opalescens]PRY00537.1 hypothetical protein CLV72_102168 [Allonocardiopsis opalescens]